MNKFESCSQSGQDVMAFYANHRIEDGFFLDIGCGQPVHWSNSHALEKAGWNGLRNDASEAGRGEGLRTSPFIIGDARYIDFDSELKKFNIQLINYASIDIDHPEAWMILENLTLPCRFITFEHDFYRFENECRDVERRILEERGYVLLFPDVSNMDESSRGLIPFEDWWVHPDVLAENERLRDVSMLNLHYWADIVLETTRVL